MQQAVKPHSSLFSLYGLLAISTCIALIAIAIHGYLPAKKLDLIPGVIADYHLFYDHKDGGSTQAVWKNERDLRFVCKSEQTSNVMPRYCGLSLKLKALLHSSAFEGYDKVQITLSYQGGNDNVRVKLHHYLPPSPATLEQESLKVLDLTFPAIQTAYPVVLENHTWHYSEALSDSVQTYADMSFVLDLVPPIVPGEHVIGLQQISLMGPMVSTRAWVIGTALIWLGATVILLLYFLHYQQKRIRNDSNRLEQLTHFSSSLQQESNEYKLLSSHDPLTNALNRHGFAQEIHQLFPESKLKLNTALIVIDLDHFKNVNDTHGHDAGDEVLRMVAQTLYKNIRINDRLVRWGGEEFVLFCVDTTTQQAQLIAEKVRVAIEGCVIEYQQSEIQVTASLGVGVANHLEEFDRLFQRTDQALYQAKGMGRNCVVFSDPS